MQMSKEEVLGTGKNEKSLSLFYFILFIKTCELVTYRSKGFH